MTQEDQSRFASSSSTGMVSPAVGEAKVIIRGLTKHYSGRSQPIQALGGVSFQVREGEFCCLVGPSGCGKTTLLRLIAGLDKPTSGILAVHSNGHQPPNAMVFQGNAVFPWMTVLENIAYGLRMRGIDHKRREEITLDYLIKMGLGRFRDAYPHQLSEGMRQRVNIARAFAYDSELLLMDEPFASLDELNRLILQDELLRLWQETGKTVLFVTHSIDEAILLGDRVLVMSAQPGLVKGEEVVPFPRPRSVFAVKEQPAFGALVSRIWSLLREEVAKARAEQAAEGIG